MFKICMSDVMVAEKYMYSLGGSVETVFVFQGSILIIIIQISRKMKVNKYNLA